MISVVSVTDLAQSIEGPSITNASLYWLSAGMQRQNLDFGRCVLCRHGPTCPQDVRGICGFAHRLAELLPPAETDQGYSGVWWEGVDRWYGQVMLKPLLDRIREYFKNTPVYERPVWTDALAWHYAEQDLVSLPECGWDFGIWADSDWVIWSRRSRGHRPFDWATGLWERMELRRKALQQMVARRSLAPEGMAEEPGSLGPRGSDDPAGIGGICAHVPLARFNRHLAPRIPAGQMTPQAPKPEAEEQSKVSV